MNRRDFLRGVGLLTTPLASFACAQSTSRVYRIGTIESTPVASLTAPADGLLRVFMGRPEVVKSDETVGIGNL